MTALKQGSFSGGEIAPNLYGRSDLSKWSAGLANCHNFMINRYGNAENRAGTEYLGTTKNNGKARLVPFVISSSQSYVLEFGNGYMRPWANGANIRFNQSTAGVAGYNIGTNYSLGQATWWPISGVYSYYTSKHDFNIGNVPGGATDSHWLKLDNVTVSGVVYGILEIYVPRITTANAFTMQYAQINGEMTLVDHSFYPLNVDYFNDYLWLCRDLSALPTAGTTNQFYGSASGSAGAVVQTYRVVPVLADGTTQGAQCARSSGPGLAITSITDGAPYSVITAVPHTMATGDTVIFFGQLFQSLKAGVQYTITSTGASAFTINELSGGGTNTGTGSISGFSPCTIIATAAQADATHPITVSWTKYVSSDAAFTTVETALKYNVYKLTNGVYGYIGSTAGLAWQDTGQTADISSQPQAVLPQFVTTNDYPSVVAVYQQRRWFANTLNQPQSYWASRTGRYNYFGVSTPIIASDAFTFVLAGKRVQFINALVDIGKLIIHTSEGEFFLQGDQSGAVTPTAQNVAQTGYAGSLPGIAPLAIGSTDLFVQARGTIIRDLQYAVQSFNYQGKDTTLFASHLFQNKQIVDMVWQQVPDSIVWCVMSDGGLLGMTYIKEHEMWAWHRHDTEPGVGGGGGFESIAIVPETSHESVYVVVHRPDITGALTIRSVERFWPRAFSDITVDACFTDSSVTYNGTVTDGTTITLTTAGGWTTTDTITVTASAPQFQSSYVGDQIIAWYDNTSTGVHERVKLTVIGYTSTTVITCQPTSDVNAHLQGVVTTWGKALSSFSGAPAALASTPCMALGDGNVEGPITVATDGTFTTANPYLILHIGLPITAQIQTLDWENTQGETITDKRKILNQLAVVFVSSRGGAYGTDPTNPTNVNTFPQRAAEPWDTPNYLLTGAYRFPLAGSWNKTSQFWITQPDPLPMCIAAVIPCGQVGA